MSRFSVFLSGLMLCIPCASAAQDIIAEASANNIKTARILPEGADFGYPMARLGDQVTLTFDILDDNYSSLAYRICHCDSDFQPDDLDFSEFADGFNDRPLQDYENSFNTLATFSHYTLSIPNRDVQPTISGNYMITIYDDDDPDTPLLTKYFMLYDEDEGGKIRCKVMQPFLPEYQMQYQQLEVSVDNSRMRVSNPDRYIKVYAMQNGDISSRRKLDISGYLGNEIQYHKNEGGNVFPGGNEFDFLDAKDVHFRPLGVDEISYTPGRYRYVMTPAVYNNAYQTRGDINGQYYVKNDRAFNLDLESDYVDATFALKYDRFTNHEIFLYGAITNWQCDSHSRLIYNEEHQQWEVTATIKQGLHNYMFLIRDKDGNFVDYHHGSHFNTQNEYLIAVYTTLMKDRGHRLVMTKVVR
ncbi:MAG: DUF5103 domain-containing protein [Bacteroidales bacterium]|nr:DUF5103 domain-containing protein [Bacteroidales bacterium]